ncbi:hypothetical protein Dimus_008432 [Dionaea muscipula]
MLGLDVPRAAMKIEMVTQIGVGRKSVVWSHEEDASKTKAWGVLNTKKELVEKVCFRGPDGESMDNQVRYEWLPIKCSKCGSEMPPVNDELTSPNNGSRLSSSGVARQKSVDDGEWQVVDNERKAKLRTTLSYTDLNLLAGA